MKKEVYRTEVAKKLKKLREDRGYKPKEVAEGANITYESYRYYETSVVPPSANLMKIAKFLGVPLDYFTDRDEDDPKVDQIPTEAESHGDGLKLSNYDGYKVVEEDHGNLTEEEALFLETFRSLSEEDRIELARYLKSKRDKK